MNTFQMSTDKVLLTVFVTVLVGFLTAAMSIVRLVNDKESKTTDYRQAWTESLRACFASLISNINTLAGLTASRMSSVDGIRQLINHDFENEDSKLNSESEKIRTYLDKRILDEDEHIREVKRAMQESYALTRLHFKPNDLSFSRVEQKFDVVHELFAKLQALTEKDNDGIRRELGEKIRSESNELTAFSRDILKVEWEAVKRGEIAYQRTKFWSIVGGAIALVGLSIFGLATLWIFLRAEATTTDLTSRTSQGSNIVTFSANAQSPQALVPPQALLQPSTSQSVNVFVPPTICPSNPRIHIPAPKPSPAASCPQ